MASKQDQALKEKLTKLGYSAFEVKPGIDEIPMLHIEDHLICGVGYALQLSNNALKALIDETLHVTGEH